MEALFVHDHIFFGRGEKIYSPGGLPKTAWNRYLENIDKLYVVSRGSLDLQKDGLVISSNERVQFDLLYQVKGGADYYRYKKEINEKLKIYIQRVNFVIIRVPSTIGFFAYKLCKELSKPYVTEVVGCAWDSSWNYGTLPVKLQAPLGFYRMKRMVKESFAAIYVTKFFLQKRYPTDTNLVSFASNVQIPNYNFDVTRENRIKFLNRGKDSPLRIGIIGNLNVKYKGFDVAFRALQKIRRKIPSINFQFLLVGGGNQEYVKGLMEKYGLASDCQVIGRLSAGEEIFRFLDSLDLYVHPSKQEGLPRSVIEAMSRACPILASSVAGIPELVDGKFLHRPGDFNKLAHDLEEVMTNVDIRVDMAVENIGRSSEFVQEVLEKRRLEFYASVVSAVKEK